MIKKDNEAYKTIGEVSEIVNLINPKNGSLSTHTLRFWEKEFKQIKPKILAGNRRYYDNDTIEIIKKVKFLLKEKGMTIQGVKKYLAEGQSELDENSKLTINTTKNLLKSKLNKISKIVKELKK